MNEETLKIKSLTHASYCLNRTEEQNPLYILLHGYQSHFKPMARWFESIIPKEANLLIPNAPYPVPYRNDKENWLMGYSWYFFHPEKREYIIGYEICQSYIAELVRELGFEENRKTIIGWSQGGYAAVHIAETLENVDKVIGVGCQFKIPNPQWNSALKVHAVHGENDTIVDGQIAQDFFNQLPEENRGQFHKIPNASHRPDEAIIKKVEEIIKG